MPDANEIDINNMKCTYPTRKFCVGDPYSIDWRWGFASGVTQILGFGVGGDAHLRVGVGGDAFSDTNMLVSPTQNSGVGGLSQHQDPTQMFLRRSGI